MIPAPQYRPNQAIAVTIYACAEYLRHRGYRIDGEAISRSTPRRVSVVEIQNAVAARFRINPSHMTSACRAAEIARPRQVAMYLSRKLTTQSMPDIGRCFGNRNHTTVMHGVRRIEKLRLVDPELDAKIKDVERELAR